MTKPMEAPARVAPGSKERRLALLEVFGEEAEAWRDRRDGTIRDAHLAGASYRELARAARLSVGGVQAVLAHERA